MITPCFGRKAATSSIKAVDSLSYCIGVNVGSGIREQFNGTAFDIKEVKRGLVKGYSKKPKLTQMESVEILRVFFSGVFRERCAVYEEAVKAGSTAPFKPFVSKKERKIISYSFGNDFGHNIGKSHLPIDISWLWRGFEDAYCGTTLWPQEFSVHYLSHYFMTVVPAQNDARSKAWLEQKSKEPGVKRTESGLLYKVVAAGDMSKAAKNDEDVVKVHYIGRLQDGRVFDASRFENRSEEQKAAIRMNQPTRFDRNGKLLEEYMPLEFPLNRVIAGWTEGMKLIGPGGKIVLYVPAELAYSNYGAGNDIGPNEALEFEVELIDVVPTAVNAVPTAVAEFTQR